MAADLPVGWRQWRGERRLSRRPQLSMRRCARPASASGSSGRSRWRTWPEAPWCGRRDSNPHSLTRSRFSCRFGFRRRPSLKDRRSWSGLSLRHSVAALGAPRLVSTPSRNPGLARDWLGLSPLAFPEFGRFYAADFPAGTPIEVCCVYHFATSAGGASVSAGAGEPQAWGCVCFMGLMLKI